MTFNIYIYYKYIYIYILYIIYINFKDHAFFPDPVKAAFLCPFSEMT